MVHSARFLLIWSRIQILRERQLFFLFFFKLCHPVRVELKLMSFAVLPFFYASYKLVGTKINVKNGYILKTKTRIIIFHEDSEFHFRFLVLYQPHQVNILMIDTNSVQWIMCMWTWRKGNWDQGKVYAWRGGKEQNNNLELNFYTILKMLRAVCQDTEYTYNFKTNLKSCVLSRVLQNALSYGDLDHGVIVWNISR